MEPAWTPDGGQVVFRSDRDGVSNLYALRVADCALRQVSNVLGGAFTPDVAPDGRQLTFASYSARGSDVHVIFPIDAQRVEAEELKAAVDEEDDKLLADDRAQFNARVDTRTQARVGRPLRIAINPARLHFFDPRTGESLLAEARAGAPAAA